VELADRYRTPCTQPHQQSVEQRQSRQLLLTGNGDRGAVGGSVGGKSCHNYFTSQISDFKRLQIKSCLFLLSFLDPERVPKWSRTLFLLLLSDFQSAKAFSFHNRRSLNFAYRLNSIFYTIAPCRILKLSTK